MDAKGEFPGECAFLENLVAALPCGVVVFDSDRRVVAANPYFERTLGIERGAALGRRGGELLACSASISSLHGCGDCACASCEARDLVVQALEGRCTGRARVTYEVAINGVAEEVELMIKAAPFEFDGREFAVVLFEDLEKVAAIRQRTTDQTGLHGIVGSHPRMLELFDAIRSVGPTNAPVLVLGESGTGKELTALALHRESARAGRLLVPVHCAALAEGVLESELFGHVKGAFTGAIRDRKGRFELADGGTIFLDEVGELSPAMQIKLLRVLQDGTFERVGSEQTVKVDVRIICATNRDLAAEVTRGRFRADLFYRLSVFPVTVPPLRERESDIRVVASHLLSQATAGAGRPCSGLTVDTLAVLHRHNWPGNVRELDNALRYALIKSGGTAIRPEHLPPLLLRAVEATSSDRPGRQRKLAGQAVADALRTAGGNKVTAARLLGVGRATLYRYLATQEPEASGA